MTDPVPADPPPAADTFCTGEQIAALLGRPVIEDDPWITQATEAAVVVTAMMRAYARQTLSLVEDDTAFLVGTRGRRLLLPERPVIEVGDVTLDGVAVSDHRSTRSGALWRDGGWGGPEREIEVEYTHGYATLPGDLVAVCRTASARLVGNPDGLVRFDAYEEASTTFSGVFGFTLAELCALNRYRRRTYA